MTLITASSKTTFDGSPTHVLNILKALKDKKTYIESHRQIER